MSMTQENSQEPEAEPELVSAPMRSLFEVTKLRNLRSNPPNRPLTVNGVEGDFISHGLLPLKEAEDLFQIFSQKMNHFLWGGIAIRTWLLLSNRIFTFRVYLNPLGRVPKST
ncbi:hypothetical protein F5884DRAFT_244 [Xylogone sp. PMI_703]|nr:hypothetical protein F5884DRAFT_244 [Xylogone sp. PMI_703]